MIIDFALDRRSTHHVVFPPPAWQASGDALPPARRTRPMTSARWEALDPRRPVIVGVGVASQHLDEPGSGLEALELMLAAARTAAEDSGARGILGAVRQIAVAHGTWQYSDPGRILADRIGAAD